ncbi:hypothetical protein D5F51_05440 [Yersinia hibernica]|uniref:Uncharacterized protein n=1 Tax=Yersinia hibernica TaxID=2339259 RepID=A0ABX5QXI8_9GAMM|nr:hypothetical protein D5F51_05440 [Yersinia hibernica]
MNIDRCFYHKYKCGSKGFIRISTILGDMKPGLVAMMKITAYDSPDSRVLSIWQQRQCRKYYAAIFHLYFCLKMGTWPILSADKYEVE